MGMIRCVRDELGIENILIGSQANIYDESLYVIAHLRALTRSLWPAWAAPPSSGF
jgi:hypothetical protein